MPTQGSARGREHAIVIGGGIAGLLAARVLAAHYRRVTVLDRDHLPDAAEPRAGTPQSHHVHVLITRGWQILRELFPDLGARLAAGGAHEIDWVADVAWHTPFGQAPRVPTALRSRACSRALLEHTCRELLRADERVRILEGLQVTGLQTLGEPARVVGVIAQRRGASSVEPRDDDLRADLVVDASGRASHAPAWLAGLGYPAPAETVIDARIGYASRLYQLGAAPDWKALYVMARAPHTPRGGVIYAIEGGRFVVTLVGYGGAFPPNDDAGFLDFARALAHPALGDALAGATPCSPVHGYRRTENRLRHFERARRWPAGFIAIGDAVCALNPVYGQGMTVSALAAALLAAELRERPDEGPGLRFQRRLAASNQAAFLTATGDDMRWPGTAGKASPGLKVIHRMGDRILAAATRNADVHVRLIEVLQLVRPASALLHPSVLRRALFGAADPAQ